VELSDVDGFEHHAGHRVSTITGSMRITFMIARTADRTLMKTVSSRSIRIITGVMMTGNAVSAVARTTVQPIPAARQNPMNALSRAWMMMTHDVTAG